MNIDTVKTFLLDLQQRICTEFEQFEPKKKFLTDEWQREAGGGGITRLIEDGVTFERGGV